MPEKERRQYGIGLGIFAVLVFALMTALYALVTVTLKAYLELIFVTVVILFAVATSWYLLGKGGRPMWSMAGPEATVLFLGLAFMSYFAIAPWGVSNIKKLAPNFAIVPLQMTGTPAQLTGSTEIAITLIIMLGVIIWIKYKGVKLPEF